jgi:hypothetical protein
LKLGAYGARDQPCQHDGSEVFMCEAAKCESVELLSTSGQSRRTVTNKFHPVSSSTYSIRPLRDDDSISDLTALLHRAYKPLLDMGLRYLATHQSRGNASPDCDVCDDAQLQKRHHEQTPRQRPGLMLNPPRGE